MISLIILTPLILYIAYKIFDPYKTSYIYEALTRYGDIWYLSNKWAKFFKDNSLTYEHGRGVPYGTKFTYYGGTWMIGGDAELYWVHQYFKGIGHDKPEYKADWNYWRRDFKSMKYIMENHPNLSDKRKSLTSKDKIPKIIKP